ncbi:MAG: non-homologous end-joining DNA ligase, partial [Burkholderiales bacterium]
EAWIEDKYDGIRTQLHLADGQPHLFSRDLNDITHSFPEVADAAAGIAHRLVIDGELVPYRAGSVLDFASLQTRLGRVNPSPELLEQVPVVLVAFDLLHLDGHDLTRLPLRTRKSLLRRALDFGSRIRFTTHRNADGEAFLAQACRKGWEGLIAKRADSRYVHKRSRNWLKFKCVKTQSLVIGGFTAAKGARHGFGALLTGYFEGGKLRYAGRVGTGFDEAMLARLRKRLDGLARASSPFAGGVSSRGVTWVHPKLICEVGYTEWTGDGRLRHPRFLGLRRDLSPKEVGKERAVP